MQGALRVVLVAVTTAGVVGFLSLIARSSQLPEQTFVAAKAPSRACMPSHCRAKAAAVVRNDKQWLRREFLRGKSLSRNRSAMSARLNVRPVAQSAEGGQDLHRTASTATIRWSAVRCAKASWPLSRWEVRIADRITAREVASICTFRSQVLNRSKGRSDAGM